VIHPHTSVFYLSGWFKLGSGGSIDPTMQTVAFSVGSYAIRLPAGSFTKYSTGYVYQDTVNSIFLCLYLKFTSTRGQYQLFATGSSTNLSATTSPVPMTLIIGQNGGGTLVNATFYSVRTGD
jgi:hypothetical protein